MSKERPIHQPTHKTIHPERIVLDLKSEAMRGPGSIPTRGKKISNFYNLNLHNIERSDRIGFKTKNPNDNITNFV